MCRDFREARCNGLVCVAWDGWDDRMDVQLGLTTIPLDDATSAGAGRGVATPGAGALSALSPPITGKPSGASIARMFKRATSSTLWWFGRKSVRRSDDALIRFILRAYLAVEGKHRNWIRCTRKKLVIVRCGVWCEQEEKKATASRFDSWQSHRLTVSSMSLEGSVNVCGA